MPLNLAGPPKLILGNQSDPVLTRRHCKNSYAKYEVVLKHPTDMVPHLACYRLSVSESFARGQKTNRGRLDRLRLFDRNVFPMRYRFGAMFWLNRNTFVGSYCSLMDGSCLTTTSA